MNKPGVCAAMGAVLMVSAYGADWPQFCGPNRDNISTETGLAETWPEDGPKVLWETAVHDGYSGPAVRSGFVYQIDRDGEDSVLLCLDLKTGEKQWSCLFSDPGEMRGKKFAGTRGTPLVTDEAVYLVTGYGSFVCIDLETHKVRWVHHLVKDFDQELDMWGMAQSPVLYQNLVLVCPHSGEAGAVAYDRVSGEKVWTSEKLGGFSYVSPEVINLCGTDMLIAVGSQKRARRGRRGSDTETEEEPQPDAKVAALSPKDGSELWSYSGWQCSSAIPHPVALPDNRLFITGGYNAGSAMIQIKKDGDGYSVQELYKTEEVGAQIHQPIYTDEHLFIGSNSNSRNDGLACLSMDGKLVWRTKDIEGAPNFERGSFILVDGKLLLLDGKSGMLHLVKADASRYQQLASAPMVKANDMAWAPLAFSDGKLLVRDWNTLKCVDLRSAE